MKKRGISLRSCPFPEKQQTNQKQTPKPHTEVLRLSDTTEVKLQRWGVQPAPGPGAGGLPGASGLSQPQDRGTRASEPVTHLERPLRCVTGPCEPDLPNTWRRLEDGGLLCCFLNSPCSLGERERGHTLRFQARV